MLVVVLRFAVNKIARSWCAKQQRNELARMTSQDAMTFSFLLMTSVDPLSIKLNYFDKPFK
jgi:hypothetical protein